MKARVTTFLSLVITLFLVGNAAAQQEVTVKQINAIPQGNINTLNAAGDGLQSQDIDGVCGGLIYAGTLCTVPATSVKFTAVVLSDPLNSGLASLNGGTGQPGRIHIFVRDVTADVEGNEGMGIQIVDGSNALGLTDLFVGDVIEVVGDIAPFNSTMQIAPTSITLVGNRAQPDPIFDPIVVTTADINKSVGADGAIQVNWDNLPDLRGNLIRIEGATVLQRTSGGDRVDWNISTDGGVTSVSMYDTSIRFRNDRGDYPANFNRRDDDFEPPPAGATVNVQGFLTYNGGTSSDPFFLGVPNGEVLAFNPMDDSDVEVTQAPINVTNIQLPDAVPGNGPTPIIADVVVDASRQISSAKLHYESDSTPGGGSVNPSGVSQGAYTFNLPAQADGAYGTYWFTATDNGGGAFESDHFPFRTLFGGITQIEQIQRTRDDKTGDAPFRNWTVDMNLNATVTLDPVSGENYVQDSTNPWSGVQIRTTSSDNPLAGLSPGDVINITRARIEESFGMTRVRDVEFTVVSQGGAPMADVTLTTNVLQDLDIAESYEGMMINVEDAYVTSSNADAPSTFGEFAISSDNDPDTSLRVDDQSDQIDYGNPDDPGNMFSVYEQLDFVRGALLWSFGNFKLVPATLADIGSVINVGTEDEDLPQTFVLEQNYPNPFNPNTLISYTTPRTGLVTLDVFDALGRRVKSLVNQQQLAGQYQVTFDAVGLSSGVYVYKLTVGADVSTKTMILLK